MELITEYLIIVEKVNSEGFYNLLEDVDAFTKFLIAGSNTTLSDGKIKQDDLECRYDIVTGMVSGKDQKYYQLRLGYQGDEKDIANYTKILKLIRGALKRQGLSPVTLRDDLSLFYSEKAYPIINKTENLMRKLITYFMITNVGKEWVTETSPKTVTEAINKSRRKENINSLHNIDFDELGEFLFKPYSTKDSSQLLEKIKRAKHPDELSLGTLKEFVLVSNWERYFSKFVECDDTYLKSRWDELYELRCEVAHNALLDRTKFERIEALSNEINPYLIKAIESIDQVHVPQADVERLAESVVSSVSEPYGLLIDAYRHFQTSLENATGGSTDMPPNLLLKELYKKGVLHPEFYEEARELINIRNSLVHGANISYTEREIVNYITRLQSLTKQLALTWKEEVVKALDSLGGAATLQAIYDYIEKNTTRALSEFWQSAVRKTLQVYSSDTESYLGGEDLFQRLDRGTWALREQALSEL